MLAMSFLTTKWRKPIIAQRSKIRQKYAIYLKGPKFSFFKYFFFERTAPEFPKTSILAFYEVIVQKFVTNISLFFPIFRVDKIWILEQFLVTLTDDIYDSYSKTIPNCFFSVFQIRIQKVDFRNFEFCNPICPNPTKILNFDSNLVCSQ